jgi:hypothetical protein
MPFGFSWGPFACHLPADQVALSCQKRKEPTTHFFDDFRTFGHTQGTCAKNQTNLQTEIKQSGFRLNTQKHEPPAQQFVSLGVVFDLVQKTTAIPTSKVQNIDVAHHKLLYDKGGITKRGIASFIGFFVFVNNAYPGFLALISPLLAFVTIGSWDKIYSYRSVSRHVEKLLHSVSSLPPCKIQVHTGTPVDLYTDATTTQLGLVLPDRTMARRIPKMNIYEAEAWAVLWLLLQEDLPKEFRIRCDNEALCHALKKGRSNTPEANMCCIRLLQLRTEGHVISVKWIATDRNPADEPSRCNLQGAQHLISPSIPGKARSEVKN